MISSNIHIQTVPLPFDSFVMLSMVSVCKIKNPYIAASRQYVYIYVNIHCTVEQSVREFCPVLHEDM